MKAQSTVSSAARSSRNSVYQRPNAKRVSSAIHPLSPSCGVQKTRKSSKSSSSSSLQSPSRINNTLSPSSRLALDQQRERQQHLITLEREVYGILEEEYRTDVTSYMHQVEQYTQCSPASMDLQPEITWHMRACLVEFLIEVHLNFQLRPETLYLTCNIVDRYVSRRVVYKKHYQLVGCAALWIAAKFEDPKERVPTLRDLCEICRDEYDESAFIQMEGHVLATIAWRVGHPSAEAWLRVLAIEHVPFEDNQTGHVARFLMEITLFYREFLGFPPSVIARAALLLARHTLGLPRRPLDETESVVTVMQLLDNHLAETLDQISEITVKKYSFSYYSKASTHILHYYLQGKRYVYTQPRLPVVPMYAPVSVSPSLSSPTISSPSSTPTIPQTPANRVIPRMVQAWSSVSSTASAPSVASTPSFSMSDFSSDADESSFGPNTPPPSSHAEGSGGSGGVPSLEPLNLHGHSGMTGVVHQHQAIVPVSVPSMMVTSKSNKENRPAHHHHAVLSSTENINMSLVMQENVAVGAEVGHGTRSRKSSLEVVQQNIPAEPMNVMAMCGIITSPALPGHGHGATKDQATYIPPVTVNAAMNGQRTALHSRGGNHPATVM